jgi:hypothetical protein
VSRVGSGVEVVEFLDMLIHVGTVGCRLVELLVSAWKKRGD